MCFNHVNTCKFWATRILVGMKKKDSAQTHLLNHISFIWIPGAHTVYATQHNSPSFLHCLLCCLLFTILSLLKNVNTLFESCYSLINFFLSTVFFLEVLAAHNSTYVGEIRDSVNLVSSPGPVTDGWQVYQWELKLAAPGSLLLRGKNSTDLPRAVKCHMH